MLIFILKINISNSKHVYCEAEGTTIAAAVKDLVTQFSTDQEVACMSVDTVVKAFDSIKKLLTNSSSKIMSWVQDDPVITSAVNTVLENIKGFDSCVAKLKEKQKSLQLKEKELAVKARQDLRATRHQQNKWATRYHASGVMESVAVAIGNVLGHNGTASFESSKYSMEWHEDLATDPDSFAEPRTFGINQDTTSSMQICLADWKLKERNEFNRLYPALQKYLNEKSKNVGFLCMSMGNQRWSEDQRLCRFHSPDVYVQAHLCALRAGILDMSPAATPCRYMGQFITVNCGALFAIIFDWQFLVGLDCELQDFLQKDEIESTLENQSQVIITAGQSLWVPPGCFVGYVGLDERSEATLRADKRTHAPAPCVGFTIHCVPDKKRLDNCLQPQLLATKAHASLLLGLGGLPQRDMSSDISGLKAWSAPSLPAQAMAPLAPQANASGGVAVVAADGAIGADGALHA